MKILFCPLCEHRVQHALEPPNPFDSFTTTGDEFTFIIGASACARCGFIFLNPRASQAQLLSYYERQSRLPRRIESIDTAFSMLLDLQISFVLSHWHFSQSARVLDVGGAEGFFLDRLARHLSSETRHELVEPSIKYNEASRSVLPNAKIHSCMLEEAALDYGAFDFVTLRHVLEHVQSPREALSIARRALKPNGALHLELPNAANWPPAVSSMFHHEHLSYFTSETLGYALGLEGFRPVVIEEWNDNPNNSGFDYPVLRAIAVPDAGISVALPTLASTVPARYTRQAESRSEFIEERIGPVRRRLEVLVNEGRSLAIFGAGPHTLDLLSALNLPSEIWKVVFDNNPNKAGKSIKGIPIALPTLKAFEEIAVVLVSSEQFEGDMARQARQLGGPELELVVIYAESGVRD